MLYVVVVLGLVIVGALTWEYRRNVFTFQEYLKLLGLSICGVSLFVVDYVWNIGGFVPTLICMLFWWGLIWKTYASRARIRLRRKH
jgi:uncharacterized membrane protein